MDDLRREYAAEIEEIVGATRRLGELGYVTSHGGNLSYRVADDVVLITATKRVKRVATEDDVVVVDSRGAVLGAAPDRKPTGETPMHLTLYELRPDLRALVHAHPAVLTGFALTDSDLLSRPLLPEPIIEVGPVISLPYAEPVSDSLANAFAHATRYSNAWLLRNHGITVGSSSGVMRALELMEMLEAMAVSVRTALTVGRGIAEIPPEELRNLENTLRSRDMAFPGDPRHVESLTQLYDHAQRKSRRPTSATG